MTVTIGQRVIITADNTRFHGCTGEVVASDEYGAEVVFSTADNPKHTQQGYRFTNAEFIPAYQQARGAAPPPPGAELPEATIRRMRDGEVSE